MATNLSFFAPDEKSPLAITDSIEGIIEHLPKNLHMQPQIQAACYYYLLNKDSLHTPEVINALTSLLKISDTDIQQAIEQGHYFDPDPNHIKQVASIDLINTKIDDFIGQSGLAIVELLAVFKATTNRWMLDAVKPSNEATAKTIESLFNNPDNTLSILHDNKHSCPVQAGHAIRKVNDHIEMLQYTSSHDIA